jgi:hypothetical protein
MAKYYCSYVFECRRKGLSCIGVSGVDHTGWMHECSTAKKTDRKSFTEFEYLVRKTLEEEGKNDIQRTLRRKESSKKVSKDYGKKMVL